MNRWILTALVWLLAASVVQADNRVGDTERHMLRAFGPWPMTLQPDAGNELSGLPWAEQLGEVLFRSTYFSGDGSRSCASCHEAALGFTDGLAVAVGAGVHVRNTQGLLDVGLQRWFGWDGGADSLWAASLRPMLSDIELNGNIESIASRLRMQTDVMQRLERAGQPLDDDESLIVLAAKAIAAYMRTLQSRATAFDAFRSAVLEKGEGEAIDSYPADARRGLSIFLGEGNCHVCHYGPNFSNQEFHDTGRPFFTGIGQVDPGRYEGIKRVRTDRYNLISRYNGTRQKREIQKTRTVTLGQVNFGQWRTPSLRNLLFTAPYMHDGSLATLRDVVDAYADVDPDRIHSDGEAIIRPLDLDDRDRDDLVAFLSSLSPTEPGIED
ncbi:MAG: cytochrome-c peroxidase [Granulosicoccus sp.]